MWNRIELKVKSNWIRCCSTWHRSGVKWRRSEVTRVRRGTCCIPSEIEVTSWETTWIISENIGIRINIDVKSNEAEAKSCGREVRRTDTKWERSYTKLNRIEFEVTSKRHQVKSKWNRRDIDVHRMWTRRELDATPKRKQCALKVRSPWDRTGTIVIRIIEATSKWNRRRLRTSKWTRVKADWNQVTPKLNQLRSKIHWI